MSFSRDSDKKAAGEEKKAPETIKDFIRNTKAFVTQLFERALEVRTGIKAFSLTKKKNLQALKASAEQLNTPKSIEILAHEVELKIAEWEKGSKQSYKDIIEGKTENKKEVFAREKNASQQNTYIKFLSMAKETLTSARITLMSIEIAKLSNEKEKAHFIAAKANEYKEEIREILVKKGELIALPQDVDGASLFKRLFPRKIIDEHRVNEYFENSPYGAYLKRLQQQEPQLMDQSTVRRDSR